MKMFAQETVPNEFARRLEQGSATLHKAADEVVLVAVLRWGGAVAVWRRLDCSKC